MLSQIEGRVGFSESYAERSREEELSASFHRENAGVGTASDITKLGHAYFWAQCE